MNAQEIAKAIKAKGSVTVRILRPIADHYSVGETITLRTVPDKVHGSVLVAMGPERKPFPLSTLVSRGFVGILAI